MKYIESPDNKEDLFSLVKEEIAKIKENFSQEEINRLIENKEGIQGDSTTACIYGTMLGDCNNKRVMGFIKKHLSVLVNNSNNSDDNNIDNVNLNSRSHIFMTPLEDYIYPEQDFDYEGEQNKEKYSYNYQVYRNKVDKVIKLLENENK